MTNIISRFYNIEVEPENELVRLIWKKESEEMLTDAEFIQIQEAYLRAVVENKARHTFIDLRHLCFTIAPDLQEKIAIKHFPIATEAGLRRVAVLNSYDVFTQISSEQLMGEDDGQTLQTRFFDNEENALNWLLKYE
jgi:hypothetical protein